MKQRILHFFIKLDHPHGHRSSVRSVGFFVWLLLFSLATLPAFGQMSITQSPNEISKNFNSLTNTATSVSLTASGVPVGFASGGTYYWYSENGDLKGTGTSLSVNEAMSPTKDAGFIVASPDLFYVEYIAPDGAVSPRISHNIKFTENAYADIIQGQQVAFCGRTQLTLTAKSVTGATFYWQKQSSNSGTGIVGYGTVAFGEERDTLTLFNNDDRSDVGIYRLVVVNASGTTEIQSYAISVTAELSKPLIDYGVYDTNIGKGVVKFCGGDTVILSGQQLKGNYKYRWRRTKIADGTGEWISPLSTSTFYKLQDEDKEGAGISDSLPPKDPIYEYRIAVTSFDEVDNPICEDILSDTAIVLDKTALPKGQIQEINAGFYTVSICPETDDLGEKQNSGGTILHAKIFTEISDVEYVWYQASTIDGIGIEIARRDGDKNEDTITIRQTGFYYVQLDDGSCKSEPSERIFVNQLEYDAPFITVDGQSIDQDNPIAYICAGEGSIILKTNFEIPIGFEEDDFIFQWYQEVRAGKADPEILEIAGATSKNYTVTESMVSLSSDNKYQVAVRHKDCPVDMLVKSKIITVKKLDINIQGEQTEADGNKITIALGKNQVVQLCPGDTYVVEDVQSDGLEDFGLATSWSFTTINENGSLPEDENFVGSSAPSGTDEGHFRASVNIPGGCEVVAFITIRKKTAEVIGAGDGFCEGESTLLELEGGPYNSYSWQYSATGTGFTEVGTSSTYLVDTEGFYKVLVTDADCEFESDPFEMKQTVPPTVLASVDGFPIGDKVLYCDNSELPQIDIALDPTPSSNVKYTWTKNDKDGNFITISAFEVTDPSLVVSENIDENEPAQYVLDVFAGGCDAQATFTVEKIEEIDFISTLPANPSGQTLCPGSSITPIKGGYAYVSPDFDFQWQKQDASGNWTTYAGAIADDGRKANLSSSDDGVYRLRVYGCSPEIEGFSEKITVSLPPAIHDPIEINGGVSEVTYCGDDGTASLSVPSGTGYVTTWFHKKNGETAFTKVGTGSSLAVGGVTSGLALGEGVYYAEVTYNAICMETTQEVTLKKATEIPDITATAEPASFSCSGKVNLYTNLSKDFKVAQRYNFVWEVYTRAGKQDPTYHQVGTEAILPNVTVNDGSTFRVTVTSKSPSCSDPKESSITIEKDGATPAELVISPKKTKSQSSLTACNNVVLTPNSAYKSLPANHYTWSLPDGSKVSGENLTASVAGSYSLKVVTPEGCEFTDNVNLTLNVATAPVLDEPSSRTLCPNGTVVLTVTNPSVGGKYIWKKDNGSGSYSEVSALGNETSATVTKGKYVVTYEAPNCTPMTSEPVEVTEADELTISIRSTAEICRTGAPISVSLNATTSATDLTYLWEKQNGSNFEPAPSAKRVEDTYEFTKEEIAGTTDATQAVYRLAVTRGGCTFYSNNITVKIVDTFSPDAKLELTESKPRVCASDKATLTLNGYAGTEGIAWEQFLRAGKQDGTWTELTIYQDKISAEVPAGTYRVSQTSLCGTKISNEIEVGQPSVTEVIIAQEEKLKAGEPFKYCGATDLQVKESASFPSGTAFKWYYAEDATKTPALVGSGSSFTLNKTSLDGIYSVKAFVGTCTFETSVSVEQTDEYDRLEYSAEEYTLCKDGTVTISVSYPTLPDGATIPTYEWRYTEGTTAKTFDEATKIDEASGDSHTFAPDDESKTHYIYVKATSSECGSIDKAVKVNPPASNTVTYEIVEDNGTKIEFCKPTSSQPSTFELQTPDYGAGYVYVWEKADDLGIFSEVTNNTSTSSNVLISNVEGIYKVGIAPSAGCALVYTDTVQVHAVDGISGSETSTTVEQFCTNESSTTLSAPAAASSSITGYAWYHSDDKTKTGTFVAVPDNGTAKDYTVSIDASKDVEEEIDAKSGWYRVDVTYSCGEKSYFVEVEISAPPSSESVKLNVDGSASLKYCAIGVDAGVTLKPATPETGGSIIYQWQKSDDGITFTDIPANENGQNTTYTATDLDGSFTNVVGTYYRLKATGSGCETYSSSIQIIGSEDGSDEPVLANSGDLELCYKADGTKEYILSVKETPGKNYDYQWLKYSTETEFEVIGQGTGLVEFPVTETGQYAVGVKTNCDDEIVVSGKVQIYDVPEDTRVPEISELKARSGASEIEYCQTDGVTLNIDNPSKAYDYVWVQEIDGVFVTATSAMTGITVKAQDDEGNVQLVLDGESEGGTFAVYLKRKSCTALSEKERSEDALLTPIDDISTITPKPKIKIEGKSDYETVYRLCDSDQSATLIATLGNYSYQWQKQDASGEFQNISGKTSEKFTTKDEGTYRVMIISSTCGELESEELQIIAPASEEEEPKLEFEQGLEAKYCSNADIKSAEISLKLTNMTESKTSILWEKSSDGKTYEQISVSGLSYTATDGYYRVTASYEGCEVPSADKDPVVIHVFGSNLAPEPEIATSSPAYYCGDGMATIRSASISGSDSIQWLYSEEENGTFALVDFTTANESRINTNVAGYYKLRIISQGCGQGDSDETIQVIGTDETPNAVITQGATAQYCPGGDVEIGVPRQELYNYQWFYKENIDDEYTSIFGIRGTLPTYNATQEGYYRAVVFFNGCRATSDSIHVTPSVEGVPTPVLVNGTKQALCKDESLLLSTTTRGSGYYYYWSYSETADGSFERISVNTPEQEISQPGFYKILVGKEGCGESVQTIEIYQIANRPEADILQDPFIRVCNGNSTILEASTQDTSFRYEWRRYESKVDFDNYTVAEGIKGQPYYIDTNIPAFYRLYVSNQGCGALSDVVEIISVRELDVPVILQAPLTGFCPNEAVMLEAKEKSSNMTYTWKYSATRSGTYATVFTGTGVDFRVYSTDVAGFYKLEASQPSCTAKESAVMQVQGVSEPPEAVINDGETNLAVCKGEIVELSAKTVPNAKYQWDGPEGFTATGQNVQVEALSIENTGTYTLTTTILGCANSSSIDVQVNGLPKFTVNPPNVICTGDATGIIEFASDDPTLTYKFGENGEFTDVKIFDELTAGTYKIFVQNTAGCEVEQNVTVQESDQLGVTLNVQDVTVDKGDSIQLNVSGANNYLWKPDNTDEFLSDLTDPSPWVFPLETTTYTVKGNSPEGCGVSQVTVTVKINYDINPNNVITPNNDNVNDTWKVNMKYAYPNATIHIYDRWGIEVYTFTGTYEDDWAGTDKKGATLPTGAYSYVIEPNHSGDNASNAPIVGIVTVVND